MPAVTCLDDNTLRALSVRLANYLSHSDITRLLKECGIPERESTTKVERLVAAFGADQARNRCANLVLLFVERCMAPVHFTHSPGLFEERRIELNQVLIHVGLSLSKEGKVTETSRASTLDEARARLNRLRQRLVELKIHPEVIRYCQTEIRDNNYFHAVVEASKSLPDRIRNISGSPLDGWKLYNATLSVDAPVVALNELSTDLERAQQRAVADLLRSLYTLYRNPLAHTAKIRRPISEEEAIEALVVMSYAHRQLDAAVRVPR